MSSRGLGLLRGNGPAPGRAEAAGSRSDSLAEASFEELVAEIIRRIGEDPDRQGLVRTQQGFPIRPRIRAPESKVNRQQACGVMDSRIGQGSIVLG